MAEICSMQKQWLFIMKYAAQEEAICYIFNFTDLIQQHILTLM